MSRRQSTHSKHQDKKKEKKIFAFSMILILTIVGVIGILLCNKEKEKLVDSSLEYIEEQQGESVPVQQPQYEIVDISDFPKTIGDFPVIGQIIIEKLGINRYILSKTNESSLALSITKFWGEEMNEEGNFSIIGHNYKGLFKELRQLEIGDTFFLVDLQGRKVEYEVYNSYSVEPNDMKDIETTRPGKEVTLITCDVGGRTRLIIKAKEKF